MLNKTEEFRERLPERKFNLQKVRILKRRKGLKMRPLMEDRFIRIIIHLLRVQCNSPIEE